MGDFLESEKPNQAAFKASRYFSEAARIDGIYRERLRPYCLPLDCAEENLFPEIRQTAPDFFATHEIKWHDGQNAKPSNHMCDSQVCCVNFLFPFSNRPQALAEVLRPVFPELQRMLPIEAGQYVTFEWIGRDNYLKELVSRNGKRSRGANCTSADAAVMFERRDGQKQMVLIEWKYTESYGGASLKIAESGRDRSTIYRWIFDEDDFTLGKDLLPVYDLLFFEPFYQLMRQQFLANRMEKVRELGVDVVSVLHIAPAHNTDFTKITSDGLIGRGKTAIDVWTNLIGGHNRFVSIRTEQLFGRFFIEKGHLLDMDAWLEYIGMRYSWLRAHPTEA